MYVGRKKINPWVLRVGVSNMPMTQLNTEGSDIRAFANGAKDAACRPMASLPIYSFDAWTPLKPSKDSYISKRHEQSDDHSEPKRRIKTSNCDEDDHASCDDGCQEPLDLENRPKLTAFIAPAPHQSNLTSRPGRASVT